MRETKFRAYHKERKEMFEIASIDFEEKKAALSNGIIKLLNVDSKQFELLQYTGLKDKNDKEIYEGDILFESFGEKYCKVIFENGSFRAEFEGDFEEYSFDLIDVVAQGYEVVGNIYENPELIIRGSKW